MGGLQTKFIMQKLHANYINNVPLTLFDSEFETLIGWIEGHMTFSGEF